MTRTEWLGVAAVAVAAVGVLVTLGIFWWRRRHHVRLEVEAGSITTRWPPIAGLDMNEEAVLVRMTNQGDSLVQPRSLSVMYGGRRIGIKRFGADRQLPAELKPGESRIVGFARTDVDKDWQRAMDLVIELELNDGKIVRSRRQRVAARWG